MRNLLPGLEKPNVTDDGRIAGVIDPTAGQDAATKHYVDLAVASLSWDYYFNRTASGLDSYYKMHPDPTGDAEYLFTTPSPLSGSGQAVFQWISDAVVPFETIEAGIINVHLHAKRATGNKKVELYAILYEYTSTPTELVIGTAELSLPLTDSEAAYDIHFALPTDYDIASTSKLLVKVLANLGSGSATTITIYVEGTHDTRVSVPVPVHTLEDLYVRRDILTANSMLYAVSADTPAALSVAASRFVGRKAAGDIAAMTVAEALTLLAHTHALAAGATDVTATAAEVNLLDLAALAAGQLLKATGAASAAWGFLTKIVDPTDQDTLVEAEEDQVTMDVAGTEAFLLNAVGILDLAKQSRAKAYMSGSQQTLPSSHVSAIIYKIIMDTEVYDEQNEFDSTLSTGTATATTANKLVDSGATFEADGIIAGAWVWNTTDNTYAEVTAVDDENTLSLDTDIMADTETYKVYNSRFTATVAGYYAIVDSAVHLSPVADKKMTVEIFINGVEMAYNQAHTSHTSSLGLQSTLVTYLGANDYVDLRSSHTYGVNKNVFNAERATFISIHKLS